MQRGLSLAPKPTSCHSDKRLWMCWGAERGGGGEEVAEERLVSISTIIHVG